MEDLRQTADEDVKVAAGGSGADTATPEQPQKKKKNENRFDLNDEKFDFIILGTGLTESIVGASLALREKKCLFLEISDKYGGTICNFNFEKYLEFVRQQLEPGWYPPNEPFRDGPRGESQIPTCASFHSFQVLVPLRKGDHAELFHDAESFKRYSRRFNIDLAPKILFSKSLSVDKLLESGVANYLEFNNVNDSYYFNPSSGGGSSASTLQEQLVKIPFSKSEIFTNSVLTFKEKRQLVKVIEMCLEGTDNMDEEQPAGQRSDDDDEDGEAAKHKNAPKSQNSTHVYDKDIKLTEKQLKQMAANRNRPVVELFKELQIEGRLQSILLYALGMINERQEVVEGGAGNATVGDVSVRSIDFFRRIAKYLRSIGYYGDSPFMMANYGSSEYSQAFSRVGSLFRNVYIVNDDLELQDVGVGDKDAEVTDATSAARPLLSSVEMNYNNTPIKLPAAGGVVSSIHFLPILERLLQGQGALPSAQAPSTMKTRRCLRATIVTKKPLLVSKEVAGAGHSYGSLATFTIPPCPATLGNVHPVRAYQQTHHIEAAPAGTYLVMLSMALGSDDAGDEGLTDQSLSKERQVMNRVIEELLGFSVAGLQAESKSADGNAVWHDFPDCSQSQEKAKAASTGDNEAGVEDKAGDDDETKGTETKGEPQDESDPVAGSGEAQSEPDGQVGKSEAAVKEEEEKVTEEKMTEAKEDTAGPQESEIEEKKDGLQPRHILFIVTYVQNYVVNPQTNANIDNLFVVPDESFEADLDENFDQAYRVVKKIKKYLRSCDQPPSEGQKEGEKSSTQRVLDCTRDNFLCRPGHEDDERNQAAYDEDYGADDYDQEDDDDLDLFGLDKKPEESKEEEAKGGSKEKEDDDKAEGDADADADAKEEEDPDLDLDIFGPDQPSEPQKAEESGPKEEPVPEQSEKAVPEQSVDAPASKE